VERVIGIAPQGGFDKATVAADVHGVLNLANSLDGGGVKESAATVPKEPRAIPMQLNLSVTSLLRIILERVGPPQWVTDS
jgi:hypothetical protein